MELTFVNDEKFDENLKKLSVFYIVLRYCNIVLYCKSWYDKKIVMICIFQANLYLYLYRNPLFSTLWNCMAIAKVIFDLKYKHAFIAEM